jgi:hypothetical protein
VLRWRTVGLLQFQVRVEGFFVEKKKNQKGFEQSGAVSKFPSLKMYSCLAN